MNQALRAADLKRPGFSCHILRHSCGTNLYQNTKDLRIVQETLRQKDPKVTARYAHVNQRIENRVTASLAIHPKPSSDDT
jgi:site-specific recombinase XerD